MSSLLLINLNHLDMLSFDGLYVINKPEFNYETGQEYSPPLYGGAGGGWIGIISCKAW